ncbi:MAG: lysophospholipid acyltransferase family protein [Acidobacteriota bacterium]|nr:lysophospholipid acyltransferase family protein [Acidobacteriota bacterium]
MQASAEQQFKGARPARETIARAYAFADLSAYSFKKRLSIRAADIAFYLLIKLVGTTARFEVEGWEHFEAALQERSVLIHTLWHDCIYLAIYFWRRRGIAYMTSQSFDGEYIARFLQRFGFGAVRGSSSRGGVGALVEMARLVRAGVSVGFTVDGPRGPRYVAKMGALLLAKKTGRPILPFNVTAARFKRTSTWDRLQIPLPFTRALVSIGAPISVPADADTLLLEAKRNELQRVLDSFNRHGEEWRAKLR